MRRVLLLLLGAVAAGGATPAHAAHSALKIHLLDATGSTITRTDPYAPLLPPVSQAADWGGRWWVKDLGDLPGMKNPVIVVALQAATSGGSTRSSAIATLLYDSALGRFTIRAVQAVGAPDTEIHYLTIFNVGPAIRLEVYEGLNPSGMLTVHTYTWNGVSFVEGAPRGDVLPAPPESLPMPPAADLRFGALPGTPFDLTTSASVPRASSHRDIAHLDPGDAVLQVRADPAGGMFASTVAVTLEANQPAATIQYTLDGSDPGPTSPVFPAGRPLWLLPCNAVSGVCTGSMTLSFRAKKAGMPDSAIGRETYQIAQAKSADTDGDGLIDLWESNRCVSNCRLDNGTGGCAASAGPDHCFDPLAADAEVDCDRDGFSDLDELRLGSDPSCGGSRPAPGSDQRRVRLSGSAALPDGMTPAAGSAVETIAMTGSDLLSHAADPNDDPVTNSTGTFADAPTRGESDVILRVQDAAEPRLNLHRFVGALDWAGLLPSRVLGDGDFTNADDWFTRWSAALRYDVALGGLTLDARSSAMLQVAEREMESVLPGAMLDLTGVPIADVDRPPTGNFPTMVDGDVDLDADGVLDRYALSIGRRGDGLTGRQREAVMDATDAALLAATLLEAAEDPADMTYTAWAAFAADVFRAVPVVGPPESAGLYHGSTDDALTDVLDGVALDVNLADEIAALPAPQRKPGGVVEAYAGPSISVLPNLVALAANVNAAAHATSAIYGRVIARGESGIYRNGDAWATGKTYRSIVSSLVSARAGNLPVLTGFVLVADLPARAIEEARLLAASGRAQAVLHLKQGIGVLAEALELAVGGGSPDPSQLANLDARMHELVYRIDRAAGDATALAALEARAGDFLLPDTQAPMVAASPGPGLFTDTVSVRLLSDEPATIYFTYDGSDPVPGAGNTFSGSDEIQGILIVADTTLAWMGSDRPWENQSAVSRATYLKDGDADGLADFMDNCPGISNPLQENFDLDAMGDACDPDDDNDSFFDAADCRSLDPTLWDGADGLEVAVAVATTGTLSWSSLAASCGPGTRYDVVRGPLGDLHGGRPAGEEFDGAICLGVDLAALLLTDPESPLQGKGFYYLVRGDNACGTGSYGSGTSGNERVTPACP